MLWKKVLLPFVFATVALPSAAQSWSVGAGTGPFIFGRFVYRNLSLGNELGSAKNTITVSAAPRPGLSADLERDLNGWLALRLDGTFTHSKLRVRGRGESNGVNLDAGAIDVTTFALPLVLHFSRRGALRFSVFGGPARALGRRGGSEHGLVVPSPLRHRGGDHRHGHVVAVRAERLRAQHGRRADPEAGERAHDHRNPLSFLT